MDTFVLVNAPWSQKDVAIGKVVAKENGEVIVNFGNPIMNHRYSKEEVIDMPQDKIVGEYPYGAITTEGLRLLLEMGIVSEADGNRMMLTLRREPQSAT